MKHALSQKFTFFSLVRFTVPTMVMMLCMSLYTIVDGIFVSRFVGVNAMSAINIVYPLISLTVAIAIMLSTGGSAIIARQLGAGEEHKARANFSLFLLSGVVIGVILALAGLIGREPLIRFLGANEALSGYCRSYLTILLCFFPASILQMLYQTFFVTEGKPGIGMGLTILSGITNIILDYVFLVPLDMGIAGAAWGTAAGQMIPALAGSVYFARRKAHLHFVKPRFDWRVLGQGCFNGASEMIANLATAITTLLFNLAMMRYAGETGVAAMTIVLYAQFLFTALYLGFSQGAAPVISYHYGSKDRVQLKRLLRWCMIFILISSVMICAGALLSAPLIALVFTPRGSATYEMTVHGFLLFSVNFLFAGVNLFASALFTALSDGKTSAIISFSRTFVFIVAGVLFLPLLWGVDGIWLAIPFAEGATLFLSLAYLIWGTRAYFHQEPGEPAAKTRV